jgi:hypothetical protein
MLAEASLLVALTVQHGSGAEACLEDAQLKVSVEKRLKRRVFVEPAEASLRLHISFSKTADGSEARIVLASIDGTPRGTRSLVTPGHCSALDDSVALSVALMVDQPPDEEPAPEPAAAATPRGEAPPATAATPIASRLARPQPTTITIPPETAALREPWHVRLGASGAGAWGVLPAIRPALALYLKLVPRQGYPITLQGEGFWPANAERDAKSGARFHLFRAGLALCPPLAESGAFGASVCVGQKLGWISAEGYGFDHDRDERRLTYALTLGGEGRLRLFAPVSLRGYLGGEVPVVRDRFASGGRDASKLFAPSSVALSGEIGLEAALW